MDNWDEIRTAYQVARMGTVSGAADALGVHHATVIRHIDALEKRLGAKLFQRHARGYTPTEAGQDLFSVASVADDQFTQLAGRIRGRGDEVTGDLVVTSLGDLSPLLVPSIAAFQARHPDGRGVREFIEVLHLHRRYPAELVAEAIAFAVTYQCSDAASVLALLHQLQQDTRPDAAVDLSTQPQLQQIAQQPLDLQQYDRLLNQGD